MGIIFFFVLMLLTGTADASSIAIQAPNEVNQGENILTNITANLNDIGSLQLELTYDSLNPVEVKQNVNAIATYNITKEKIALAYITTQGITGNVTLAQITFKAINAGESKLVLSVDATDTKSNPISIGSSNATIIVKSQSQASNSLSQQIQPPNSNSKLQTPSPTQEKITPTMPIITSTETANRSDQASQQTPASNATQPKTSGFEIIFAIAGLITALRWLK